MSNYYCTFGGRAYDATIAKIIAHARPCGGVDDVWVYDEPWLMAQPFYRDNQWAWKHPGHNGHKYGWGWYIWKPYVIRHAMQRLAPGDVLLWSDADTYPIDDFRMLFGACRREGGIFVFEATGCTNRQWVKRDVWEAVFPNLYGHKWIGRQVGGSPDMVESTEWVKYCSECGGEDNGIMFPCIEPNSQHATARFMLFQKGAYEVAEFLRDWETLCCVPGLTTRDPSKRPEFPGFEENRGDQSIFSVLCLKYGLPLHREADAFGEASDKDRELYGQIFRQKYCAGDRNDLSGSKYRRIPDV